MEFLTLFLMLAVVVGIVVLIVLTAGIYLIYRRSGGDDLGVF